MHTSGKITYFMIIQCCQLISITMHATVFHKINEAYSTVEIALTLISTNVDFNIEINCVNLTV